MRAAGRRRVRRGGRGPGYDKRRDRRNESTRTVLRQHSSAFDSETYNRDRERTGPSLVVSTVVVVATGVSELVEFAPLPLSLPLKLVAEAVGTVNDASRIHNESLPYDTLAPTMVRRKSTSERVDACMLRKAVFGVCFSGSLQRSVAAELRCERVVEEDLYALVTTRRDLRLEGLEGREEKDPIPKPDSPSVPGKLGGGQAMHQCGAQQFSGFILTSDTGGCWSRRLIVEQRLPGRRGRKRLGEEKKVDNVGFCMFGV